MEPRRSNFREIWLPWILFALTVGSTFWAGLIWSGAFLGDDLSQGEGFHSSWALGGLSYCLPLMAILGCHEMGHYLMARYLKVPVSLPFFIPVPPIFLLGTLGAIIRLKGIPPDRSSLLKIGAAGPLAGGVIALVVMVFGIATSVPIPVPDPAAGQLIFGDSLTTLALQAWIWPELGESQTLVASPTFMAGWAGFLITMLNLLPMGQLDGGHVGYALWGDGLNRFWWLIAILVGGLAIFGWFGWLVWVGIAMFFGRKHFPLPNPHAPLDRLARGMAWACAIMFLLTFMPAPIELVTQQEVETALTTVNESPAKPW